MPNSKKAGVPRDSVRNAPRQKSAKQNKTNRSADRSEWSSPPSGKPRPRSTKPSSRQVQLAAKRLNEFTSVAPFPDKYLLDPVKVDQHKVATQRAELINQMIDAPTDEGIAEIVIFAKSHLGGLCTNCKVDTLVMEALVEIRQMRENAAMLKQQEADKAQAKEDQALADRQRAKRRAGSPRQTLNPGLARS
ncbi:MAG: hypothetical protein WAO28_01575 [Candidatus Microsaccharimonas sp.]